MSYFKRRPMNGMGGAMDYATGQWNAPTTQPTSPAPIPPSGQPATTPPPDPTKSDKSSWSSDLVKIFGALALNKIASPQTSPQPYVQAPSGMSTQTMMIAGGLGVVALVLLLKD